MQDRDEKAREGLVAKARVRFIDGTEAVISPPFTAQSECRIVEAWIELPSGQRVPFAKRESDTASDIRAAKERLGAWLAAEPERSWSREIHEAGPGPDDDACVEIWLSRCGDDPDDRDAAHDVYADGPTEGAAILAALEKVNGGA